MRAMVMEQAGQALRLLELPRPRAGAGELLLKVTACGICRTDLHVVDGELTEPTLPLIPGHQIVGQVEAATADGQHQDTSHDADGENHRDCSLSHDS